MNDIKASSALHTGGVAGSNPASPTIRRLRYPVDIIDGIAYEAGQSGGLGALAKWQKIANVGGTWRGDSGEIRVAAFAACSRLAAILALGFALAGPARAEMADTAVYWGPETDLEAIDVGEIDKAETSIDMFAYVLTDRAIVDALRDAGARGVKVRIWRDAEMARKTADYDVAAQLGAGAAGIEVRIKPPGELMHLKAYCVDGRTLRTGGSNFSRSGETRQDNDLEIIRSASACAAFEAKFQEAWGK